MLFLSPERAKEEYSLFKFGVQSWMVRLLYAISVCIHICIHIFYAYGIALPCSLGFISSMNVSVLSNPYQSVMPSLRLHFQYLFLLKIYSGIGLVCTRFGLSRHLVGAWLIMWVRMSIMGCFATRAACCGAVPIQRGGLIAQPDSDVWGKSASSSGQLQVTWNWACLHVQERDLFQLFLC